MSWILMTFFVVLSAIAVIQLLFKKTDRQRQRVTLRSPQQQILLEDSTRQIQQNHQFQSANPSTASLVSQRPIISRSSSSTLEENLSENSATNEEIRAKIPELKQKITRLKTLDNRFFIFGASGHKYGFFPRLSLAEVQDFEQQYQVKLPDDYRAFICQIGNGGAGPYYGLLPLVQGAGILERPYPWTEPIQLDDEQELDAWLDEYPGIIQLSHHGCGYYDFLVVHGEAVGTVWSDWTAAGGALEPCASSFLEWYTNWVDTKISILEHLPLLDRVYLGMTVEQMSELFGTEMYRLNIEHPDQDPSERVISFVNVPAVFSVNEDGKVVRINRLHCG
jgi:hypothetical protein